MIHLVGRSYECEWVCLSYFLIYFGLLALSCLLEVERNGMVEWITKLYVKKKPIYPFQFFVDGKAMQRHRAQHCSTLSAGYICSSSAQSCLPFPLTSLQEILICIFPPLKCHVLPAAQFRQHTSPHYFHFPSHQDKYSWITARLRHFCIVVPVPCDNSQQLSHTLCSGEFKSTSYMEAGGSVKGDATLPEYRRWRVLKSCLFMGKQRLEWWDWSSHAHLWCEPDLNGWLRSCTSPPFYTQQKSWLENKKEAWCTLEGKLAAKISNEVPLFCCLSSFHLLSENFPRSVWCLNLKMFPFFLAAAASSASTIQRVKLLSALGRLCMLLPCLFGGRIIRHLIPVTADYSGSWRNGRLQTIVDNLCKPLHFKDVISGIVWQK